MALRLPERTTRTPTQSRARSAQRRCCRSTAAPGRHTHTTTAAGSSAPNHPRCTGRRRRRKRERTEAARAHCPPASIEDPAARSARAATRAPLVRATSAGSEEGRATRVRCTAEQERRKAGTTRESGGRARAHPPQRSWLGEHTASVTRGGYGEEGQRGHGESVRMGGERVARKGNEGREEGRGRWPGRCGGWGGGGGLGCAVREEGVSGGADARRW